MPPPAYDRCEALLQVSRANSEALASSVAAMRAQRQQLQTSLRTARRVMESVRANRDDALVELTMPASTNRSPRDREIWRLHIAYARRRDAKALERLVENYLPRTDRRARLATKRPGDLEDRTQVAREALVLALQRFDPSRRIPFEAFADATIGGQLRKHVRDFGWLVRAPRRVHELIPAIRVAIEQLTQELGQSPTPEQVAVELDVPVEDVLMALSTHDARSHQSLDALVYEGHEPFDPTRASDPRIAQFDDADALRRALATISDADRNLIRDYFLVGKTQQEIASDIGMSQMHVSRVLRRVLRVLATRVDAERC